MHTCGGVSGLEYLKATEPDKGGSNSQHHRTAFLLGVPAVECVTCDPAV